MVNQTGSKNQRVSKSLPKPFCEMTLRDLKAVYGPSHTVKSILSTDARRVYKKSDRPTKCFICGYRSHIDIAHIRAVADFPMESLTIEINHPDNLIALCKLHHKEFDEGLLDLSDKSRRKAAMDMIKRGTRMLEELDGIRMG